MRRDTLRTAILAVAVVGAVALGATAEGAPSFDCRTARTAVDRTICGSEQLSDLDRSLAEQYLAARDQLPVSLREWLREDQRLWLAERSLVCAARNQSSLPRELAGAGSWMATGNPTDCLVALYEDRLKEIGSSVPSGMADFPMTRQPFVPKLILSKDSTVCPALEKAVRHDYLGVHSWPQLSRSVPLGWDGLVYGEPRIAEGAVLPWDEESKFLSVGLRIDGQPETALLRYVASHGTFYSFDVFLRDGSAGVGHVSALVDMASQSDDSLLGQGWRLVWSDGATGKAPFRIALIHGHYYILADAYDARFSDRPELTRLPGGAVALLRIGSDDPLEPACIIAAAPQEESVLATAPSAFKDLLGDIDSAVGGRESGPCSIGSMWGAVWGGIKNKNQFFRRTALTRPWELARKADEHAMRRVSALLQSWGFQSLYNYRIYNRIERELQSAEEALAAYYQDQFGVDRDAGRAAAHLVSEHIVVAPFLLDSTTERFMDDGLRGDDFRRQFRAALAGGQLDPQIVRKAILLGMTDLIADTTSGLLDFPQTDLVSQAAPDVGYKEPYLFYALDLPAMVRLLLDKGAVPDSRNWFGKTALMYAAQWDLIDTAKVLIDKSADLNARTTESTADTCDFAPKTRGRTALMYAAENASPPLIQLLIGNHANASLMDSEGHDALWYLDKSRRLSPEEKERARRLISESQ
jgi:uncharacterized protein YecT (DUF1311 family)